MKLLILSATFKEIRPFVLKLKKEAKEISEFVFQWNNTEISILLGGVGMMSTTFHLSQYLLTKPCDLIIHAGIAGSLDPDLAIGEVVQIVNEQYGDFGASEKDGSLLDVYDLELNDPNAFPFEAGKIENLEASKFNFLKSARGYTVQRTTGTTLEVELLRKKYKDIQIESMESMATFYIGRKLNKSFLSIRSISNYVESRNRANWNIPLALKTLNEVLFDMVEMLSDIGENKAQ